MGKEAIIVAVLIVSSPPIKSRAEGNKPINIAQYILRILFGSSFSLSYLDELAANV